MSHIRFDNGRQHVEIRGSERAHMDCLIRDLAKAAIGSVFDTERDPHWLRNVLPPDVLASVLREGRIDERMALLFCVGTGCDRLQHPITGEPLSAFTLALNTAMVMGGPEVRLMARLHGQCEVHGYIPRYSLQFIANIIRHGLEQRIFRRDQGWGRDPSKPDGVFEFLMASASNPGDWPVVMSYSVCDTFPGEAKWSDAVRELETHPGKLAIRMEDFSGDWGFGDGLTWFDIQTMAQE